MPNIKLNARDLIVQVSDMAAIPVWTAVGGITESEIDYAGNEEAEDTTTYDDQGQYSQEIMQRGRAMTLSGKALVDDASGAREPGQALLNTHATATGPDSKVDIRMRYPLDTTWVVWSSTVSRKGEGGGNNAKVGFEYELTKCGAATSTAVTP